MSSEKLDNIYLDYNSTSPLAKSVQKLLSQGDFLFANASSQHKEGKQVAKSISESKKSISQYFNNILESSDFSIYFHSGATEAFNTFFNLRIGDAFFYFATDHGAIHAIAAHLENLGITICCLEVDELGMPKVVEAIAKINNYKEASRRWLNFTQVNNETGVVWPLSIAQQIKRETNILVHVDAVQSIGKIKTANQLSTELDGYTYSGHKFGALKGIGFSIYKKSIDLIPILLGGSQQEGLRSGTVNSHGIFSLVAALKDVVHGDQFHELNNLKDSLIDIIQKNNHLSIIANDTNNTICLINKNLKSDLMLIHFDMAALMVSAGSACSSGNFTESSVLKAMGISELAGNMIRISLGPMNLENKDQILKRMSDVIKKL